MLDPLGLQILALMVPDNDKRRQHAILIAERCLLDGLLFINLTTLKQGPDAQEVRRTMNEMQHGSKEYFRYGVLVGLGGVGKLVGRVDRTLDADDIAAVCRGGWRT